ncbi:AGAP002949-PA [Anopheles gambiae str. PEST]|uniref:AGAP002949-PA n=1 Tax=Anopheles gambiae TaxID=7165 RepID=Q7QD44_ANOGA|nr:AGAP002949-PA [Anopheles gambiae str. PEST]
MLASAGSVCALLAFVNEEGPERLRLIAAPPSHVIVTGSRSAPVYLPCQAELGPDTSDDIPNSSYGDEYLDEHNEEDEEEEEDEEGYDEDTDEMEDDFLPHTSSLVTNNDLTNGDHRQQQQQQQQQAQQTGQHFSRQYKDYDDTEEEEERRRRRRRKRYVHTQRRGGEYYGSPGSIFEYVWYRNGLEFLTTSFQSQNQRQTHKGFRLFENGTLRILYNRQNGNIVAGVYRCMATLVSHQQRYQGSILSTESTVSIAYLERDNQINFPNNTIVVRANEPTVLPCPFQSYPAANITWSMNKTVLQLHSNFGNARDSRFFLLQNGSLLITDVQLMDSGRYRCNATNNYVAKNVRSTSFNLAVISAPPSSLTVERGKRLLPPLQPVRLSVRAGDTLRLHCACYSCKPQWLFTPRQSQIPIRLENFTHQVAFVNVSVERHEGTFTCRTPDGTDRQAFNVTVLVAPAIVSKIASYTSSVVASMAFNCTVTGNPMPAAIWYKNGRELTSNYIVHHNYPMLQINTLDPEDEGLYQCMARNEAGEVSVSSYLTIRDRQKYRHKAKRLDGIRCYPVDTTSLYLTFTVPPHVSANIEYVMYYLASDDPFRWYSSPPTHLAANGSLRISGKMVEPFRNYTVFLRACSVSDISGTENMRGNGAPGMQKVIPSRLSRGIRCASQGYPILSTFFPNNGIFIWWPKHDGIQPTAFTIQLRHGGNSNLTTFTNQIIGTVDPLDDYMSHDEVEPLLGKIEAETKELQDWLWNENDAAEGVSDGNKGAENLAHQRRRRRRRQSHREGRRNRHAFDLSKDRKQIFDSLATSGAMDVDVPIPVNADHIRSSNVSSIQAAVAAAKLSTAGQGSLGDDAQARKTHQQITVTQVKVAGNVTGILLPNIRSVMVRVLGSLAADGEPAVQDLRYVEWKVIDTDAPRTDAVNRFQASHIDSRSVQFTWSRFVATKAINRCLQLCYKNVNYDVTMRGGSNRFDCQKIPKDASYYNVKDLVPVTMYKAFLKPCESTEALSDILDFQTKHDVPGPVTNHELHRKGGTISITWGPPENRNGVLQGYLVEWITEDSVQHSANLSADAISFTFPNVTSDERINISLRALSTFGLGIPIYLNLKNYEGVVSGGDGNGAGNPTGYNDRWLFQLYLIAIVLILFVVMGIFCYLLLRRKACKKANSSSGAPLNNRAPVTTAGSDVRHHLAIDASAMQMMGMITGCNNDMHEMQTLIRSSNNYPARANGTVMANGLAINTYGQTMPETNPVPVAALITRNRPQPRKSYHAPSANVPLSGTGSTAASKAGPCTVITSYKELLGKERLDCVGSSSSSSSTSSCGNARFAPTVSNIPQRSSTKVGVLKQCSPVEFDSSQRRLLETTLDSNTSTIIVEEAKQQQLDIPAALAPPPPPPTTTTPQHPVEIYDYDYATNCDDEREDERDHSRQLLLAQECREVPEHTTSPLMGPMPTDQSTAVLPTLSEQENKLHECITRRQQSKTHDEVNQNYRHANAFVSSNGVELALAKHKPQTYNLKRNQGEKRGHDDDDNDDDAGDDDDDDDDELDNSSSLLNSSSLSTKPLHQQNHTSSWNFRRPIIGPNG